VMSFNDMFAKFSKPMTEKWFSDILKSVKHVIHGSICHSNRMEEGNPCPVGYYCPGSGLSSPLLCPPGSICPSSGIWFYALRLLSAWHSLPSFPPLFPCFERILQAAVTILVHRALTFEVNIW
jgi:hypothetical protein